MVLYAKSRQVLRASAFLNHGKNDSFIYHEIGCSLLFFAIVTCVESEESFIRCEIYAIFHAILSASALIICKFELSWLLDTAVISRICKLVYVWSMYFGHLQKGMAYSIWSSTLSLHLLLYIYSKIIIYHDFNFKIGIIQSHIYSGF